MVAVVLIAERQVTGLVSLFRVIGIDESGLCLEPLQTAVFLRLVKSYHLEQSQTIFALRGSEVDQHPHVLAIVLALQGGGWSVESEFWRFGRGIVARLNSIGTNTMGQLARLSVNNEELLYQIFGVNAELIIDHAWGWEPVTIDYIKAYKPETNSLGSGQVLQSPYSADKGRVVVREMADALSLDLVDKHLVGDQIVLTVGYDRESLTNPAIRAQYHGEITTDWYGRSVPKHAHGTLSLGHPTSSSKQILEAVTELYDHIVNPILLVRRLNITVNHVIPEAEAKRQQQNTPVQLDLFTNYEAEAEKQKQENEAAAKERRLQEAALKIKKKFGKNALLRGLNYAEGATQKDRNNQIGGHKA